MFKIVPYFALLMAFWMTAESSVPVLGCRPVMVTFVQPASTLAMPPTQSMPAGYQLMLRPAGMEYFAFACMATTPKIDRMTRSPLYISYVYCTDSIFRSLGGGSAALAPEDSPDC